ncbi:MAG TPA: methyltetrahydrofolate cobalamin methyltransferase [Firmicutes bacterium]|nr:methyltetrahydrofolate cobalamin methyltransferase [Bacillota bacterium]
MLIIGEKINSTRRPVQAAVARRDEAFIHDLAKRQVQAGAGMLDVNCGTLEDEEPEALAWAVRIAQDAGGVPISIDTPNACAMEAALKVHRGKPLINSITAQRERLEGMLPIIKGYSCSVIALCMNDDGVPELAEGRVEVARYLVEALAGVGVSPPDIYLDPLVEPVSVAPGGVRVVLDTIERLRELFPECHIICGVSNVSFGLPRRSLLNRSFLGMCMAFGADAVIVDPEDRDLMATLRASDTLLGRDEFCAQYMAAFHEGLL